MILLVLACIFRLLFVFAVALILELGASEWKLITMALLPVAGDIVIGYTLRAHGVRL